MFRYPDGTAVWVYSVTRAQGSRRHRAVYTVLDIHHVGKDN